MTVSHNTQWRKDVFRHTHTHTHTHTHAHAHTHTRTQEDTRAQKLHGTGHEISSVVFGADEMRRATAESFGCDCLARGRGSTDTVGSVEAIQAILDKSRKTLGADHDWVSVDTNDRLVYMFDNARRIQALSKVRMKAQPDGNVTHLHVHDLETEGVSVLLSAMPGAVGTKFDGTLVDGSVRTNTSGQ